MLDSSGIAAMRANRCDLTVRRQHRSPLPPPPHETTKTAITMAIRRIVDDIRSARLRCLQPLSVPHSREHDQHQLEPTAKRHVRITHHG